MRVELKGLIAAVIAGVFVVGASFGVAKIMAPETLPAPAGTATEASSSGTADPAYTQAQIIEGGAHFRTSCQGCHGFQGAGGGGAPELQNEQMSDSQIMAIVSAGNGPMPSFASTYNHRQISSIIAYIRSLSRNGSPAT